MINKKDVIGFIDGSNWWTISRTKWILLWLIIDVPFHIFLFLVFYFLGVFNG